MSAKLVIVAAVDEGMGVGRDGVIPWHDPEDLRRFRSLTLGGTVAYGFKTWRSLPLMHYNDGVVRGLPGRRNILITDRIVRDPQRVLDPESSICMSVAEALAIVEEEQINGPLYVIGGHSIWTQAFDEAAQGFPTLIYLTRVQGVYDCDVLLPPWAPEGAASSWTRILDTPSLPIGNQNDISTNRFQIYSNF